MCCLPHKKVGTLTSATSEPTRDGGWPPGVLMKHSHDGTMTGLSQGAVAWGGRRTEDRPRGLAQKSGEYFPPPSTANTTDLTVNKKWQVAHEH